MTSNERRFNSINFYVKNLDESINDEILYQLFSPFGQIISAKVMTEGGRSKGFGFVCFASSEVADIVLREMNGKYVYSKALYVGVAQKKEERARQLSQQYAKHMPTN